jgi:hypothetical protein
LPQLAKRLTSGTHNNSSHELLHTLQISKLLIIPFVCVVEATWHKRRYTLPVLGSIVVVICGVAIVCVGKQYNRIQPSFGMAVVVWPSVQPVQLCKT